MNTTSIESSLGKTYFLYATERYCSGRISGYRIINGQFRGEAFKTKTEMFKFAAQNGFGLKQNLGNYTCWNID